MQRVTQAILKKISVLCYPPGLLHLRSPDGLSETKKKCLVGRKTYAAVSDDVQKYSECSVVHFPLHELLGSEDVEARVLVKALLFVVLGLCGCYSGDFFNIQLILLNIGLYRGVVQSVVPKFSIK